MACFRTFSAEEVFYRTEKWLTQDLRRTRELQGNSERNNTYPLETNFNSEDQEDLVPWRVRPNPRQSLNLSLEGQSGINMYFLRIQNCWVFNCSPLLLKQEEDDHFLPSQFNSNKRLIYGSVPIDPHSSNFTSIPTSSVASPSFDIPMEVSDCVPQLNISNPSSPNLSVDEIQLNISNPSSPNLSPVDDFSDSELNTLPFPILIESSSSDSESPKNPQPSKSNKTETEKQLYRLHRNTMSRVSKLKARCNRQKTDLTNLRDLYKSGDLENIRNASRKPRGRCWSDDDKAFALSMYKRSGKLYRYLSTHFSLPSIPTLKNLLGKIQLSTGINELYLEHLKLIEICGFVDLGHLGRTAERAEHALVFMICGISNNWKEIVAYYLTQSTISSLNLKLLIVEIISKLQSIVLKVRLTVCDQGSTNRGALNMLSRENTNKPGPFYFEVNNKRVYFAYDVPHLLKSTRNALLRCNVQFDDHKFVKFEHIIKTFVFDRSTNLYRMCPKLSDRHFDFKNSFTKMKVSYAAQTLSYTVSSAILSLVSGGEHLPSDATHTAEFVHLINSLFDSLNGMGLDSSKSVKPVLLSNSVDFDEEDIEIPDIHDLSNYQNEPLPDTRNLSLKFALTEDSGHLEFWSDFLIRLQKFKLIEIKSSRDVTNQYNFLKGWDVTIRSVMALRGELKLEGFNSLSTRFLNQDPIENLFCQIRQHRFFNTNPSCFQFIAALKTVIINKLSIPLIISNNNTEDDKGSNLGGFSKFLAEAQNSDIVCKLNIFDSDFDILEGLMKNASECQGTSYVAGYLLRKIQVPQCPSCHKSLFSENVTEKHALISFKEFNSNVAKLIYPSDLVIEFFSMLMENALDQLTTFFRMILQNVYEHDGSYTPFQSADASPLTILSKSVQSLGFSSTTSDMSKINDPHWVTQKDFHDLIRDCKLSKETCEILGAKKTGHRAKECTGKKKCLRCSRDGHRTSECTIPTATGAAQKADETTNEIQDFRQPPA
ncbi:unnamed protein product [Brassicogethes aeneus]|uniref:CCHC-type domain-containing protein n=1 Tax=Brassicogethes aeneus TaxID=1431903 RepID=A0A9P0BCR2_BRAAE|nr:unnamed protein product [Brassicogethes aeneus]